MTKPEELKVLFLCTGNSARSQMAEGWARHFHEQRIEAYSTGTEAHGINPLAVEVMNEVGIDITDQYSKTVDRYLDVAFDYVITLCGDARDSCPVFAGDGEHVHVGLDDPAAVAGTKDEKLAKFREVRAQLRQLIENMPGSLSR